MRGARWFLLIVIAALLAGVGTIYRRQRRENLAHARQKPAQLPEYLSGKAERWKWRHSVQARTVVEIEARNFKQSAEQSRIELDDVQLKIYHEDQQTYDDVKCERAVFSPGDRTLFSEQPVTITLSLPAEGEPKKQPVTIKTSGVSFESQTGKAYTDRLAEFTFEHGTGKSMGAHYDPTSRELQMRSQVEINWRAGSPAGKLMRLEAGTLIYKERLSQILLFPWARMHRDHSVMEAGDTLVTLKDEVVQTVEAKNAKGHDQYPKRQLDYSASQLTIQFDDKGEVNKVTGEPDARVVAVTDTARTTMTGNRVDLEFATQGEETVLTKAFAHGKGVVESRPLAGGQNAPPGPNVPDTRILRSEVIELTMRAGGQEIDAVQTHAKGHIDFLPNRPGGRGRQMDGERMWIYYGARNVLKSFRAVEVETTTDPATPKGAAAKTWSKNLEAAFDEKGQLTRIDQWDNFRYEEGTRKATAARASNETAAARIRLETAARVSDDSGSTTADRILLNQSSGDYVAEGHVSSSRRPDQKPGGKSQSGLMSGDDPVQATAERMTSARQNTQIRYDGNAVMWQGANRVKADTIDIDREASRLVATGKVETQFVEKPKEGAEGKPARTGGLTVVRSAGLVYTDSDRLAYYTGGVLLIRPSTRVKSMELRATLAEAGSDSSIERALADGKVEIVQTQPDRTRTGNSEHADYVVSEEKIVLRGGAPVLTDSRKGITHGEELTYFSGDDRLLVNGAPAAPASSRLHKK